LGYLENCEPIFGGKDDDKPSIKSPEISNSIDGLHWEFRIHILNQENNPYLRVL
jgi:hypothetical protein